MALFVNSKFHNLITAAGRVIVAPASQDRVDEVYSRLL